MKSKERDKSILEYVQCMYNNVHAYKVPGLLVKPPLPHKTLKDNVFSRDRSARCRQFDFV